MKRYVALLRGINISGRNRIPMDELKKGFEELAFQQVRTYLNSGNVIFDTEEEDAGSMARRIRKMITEKFVPDIPVHVMELDELADILNNAPDWWDNGDPEIYDNLIFILPPARFSDVYAQIGEPKEGLERIEEYRNTIFWSFRRKDYQKTNWWPKTASAKIKDSLTIRTANTVRKIIREMLYIKQLYNTEHGLDYHKNRAEEIATLADNPSVYVADGFRQVDV